MSITTKENRKKQILEIAIKVFSEEGFHKAKIEDIANKANIGKGTVYQYFSSKKDLFKEMVEYCMLNYNTRLESIVTSEQHIRNKLLILASFNDDFVRENFDMAQILLYQSDVVSREMKQWIILEKTKTYGLIEKMIEIGINKKEIRQDIEKNVAVSSLIGTMNQYLGKRIVMMGPAIEKIDYNPLVNFFMKALQ